MLIKDSETNERISAGDARSEHRQTIADTVTHKTAAEVTDIDLSPTNPLRQWGNAMATPAFEAKLKTILPDFIVTLHHPTNTSKKCLYLNAPGEGLVFLLAYEYPMIPEHSILEHNWEDVPDMSVESIDKKDMPAARWVDDEVGFEFDTSAGPLPGYVRKETAGAEKVRGWRTVLLMLVNLAVITPAQAEAAFGSDGRKEWAHGLGKVHAPTPWCG